MKTLTLLTLCALCACSSLPRVAQADFDGKGRLGATKDYVAAEVVGSLHAVVVDGDGDVVVEYRIDGDKRVASKRVTGLTDWQECPFEEAAAAIWGAE